MSAQPIVESNDSPTRRWSVVVREMAVISAYFLLTALMTFPLVFNFAGAIPGDGGDGWQNYWNLWWVKRALLELSTSPYFTTEIYYPSGAPLYFHSLLLLPSLLAMPVVSAFGLTIGYNFLVVLAFVMGGYGAYRLVMYLLQNELAGNMARYHSIAAFIAGATFTFSSYHFIRLLGHMEQVSLQWLPFYALFLFKTWREHGLRNPLLATLFLAIASLTTWYFALYLFCFTALFVIYNFLIERHAVHLWQSLRRVGVAVGIYALALAPVLAPMLLLGNSLGRVGDPYFDAERFSADLLAFAVPSPLRSLGGPDLLSIYQVLWRNGNLTESVVFLGYVPMLLAVYAAWSLRARQRFWMVAFISFTIMALGPVLHIAGKTVNLFDQPLPLPYQLFFHVPYGDIARVPSRFAVMSTLCLAVLTGYGAFLLLNRLRRRVLPAILAPLILALILLENAVVPYPMTPVTIPPFYFQLAQEPARAAILEVPIPDDPSIYPLRMLYQTAHGKPTFGGYISRGLPPLAFSGLLGFAQFKTLTPFSQNLVNYDANVAALSRDMLSKYNVGYVVIEKKLLAPAQVQRARQVATSILNGAEPSYEDEWTLAYSMTANTMPPDILVYLDAGWYGLETAPPDAPATIPPRWRWISEEAKLGVQGARAGEWRLKIRASSFSQPRRLMILLDDVPIATFNVKPEVDSFETPAFSITSGNHWIRLRSLDGAAVPGGDPRPLSVAISEIYLEPMNKGRECLHDCR